MADCEGFASNSKLSRLAFLRRVLTILVIVVACWPKAQSMRSGFSREPSGNVTRICPTHMMNGSAVHCHGETQFRPHMDSICNPKQPAARKDTENGTKTLELMPGIHKVTISIPKYAFQVTYHREKHPWRVYVALRWNCDYPLLIAASDPAKTIILLELGPNAAKKSRFNQRNDQVVPIYFSSNKLVSFRSVTFRSAVPYATYALILFHSKNIELSDCNFPDLDELHGGIAIQASKLTSRKGDPAALITDCNFNVSYTMTDGPRQDTWRLAPALRVGVFWEQLSNHKGKKTSFHVHIVRSSFQVFGRGGVFRNQQIPGRRKKAKSKAYR